MGDAGDWTRAFFPKLMKLDQTIMGGSVGNRSSSFALSQCLPPETLSGVVLGMELEEDLPRKLPDPASDHSGAHLTQQLSMVSSHQALALHVTRD